jgi:hypothetical protein
MHEYSSEELDLMAKAYERACEELSKTAGTWPANIEAARTCLVDGIVDAIKNGVRNEDGLIAAALSRLGNIQEPRTWQTTPVVTPARR